MSTLAAIQLVLAVVVQLPIGGGWEETHAVFGGIYQEALGTNMAGIGDVDGDGAADFAIVGTVHEPGTYQPPPALHLYSGRTGAYLLRVTGPAGEYIDGGVAAAGDVDGDGVPDVIAGSYGLDANGLMSAGSTFVFSGLTGATISRSDGTGTFDRLGMVVAAVGDVDGDGRTDYFSGSEMASRNGTFHGAGGLFSGATGLRLLDLEGEAAGDAYGAAACGVGDWDGDGVPDFVVGAPRADPAGAEDAGTVYLYSGATGLEIFRWSGLDAQDEFGCTLALAGDADGDGHDDLLIGAQGVLAAPGERAAGAVYVVSGATRLVISSIIGSGFESRLGAGLAAAGDQDQDGFADYYVAAPGARVNILRRAGLVFLISGATRLPLFELHGEGEYHYLGETLADAGDLDGDRSRHLMVAVREDAYGYQAAGAVRIHSHQPYLSADALTLSAAQGGTVRFHLDFPADAAGDLAQILLSRSGTGPTAVRGELVPLSRDGWFAQSLAGLYPTFCTSFLSVLGADGESGAAMTLAPNRLPASSIGSTIHFSALARRISGSVRYVARAQPLLILP